MVFKTNKLGTRIFSAFLAATIAATTVIPSGTTFVKAAEPVQTEQPATTPENTVEPTASPTTEITDVTENDIEIDTEYLNDPSEETIIKDLVPKNILFVFHQTYLLVETKNTNV